MSIAELLIAVPAPQSPTYSGTAGDWGLIERILGTELPEDYKNLINVYGTGSFFNFLSPLSPFAPFSTGLNLLSNAKQLLSAYESGRKEFPEYSPPFEAYPHSCGVFPWATTVNGDVIFWLMRGRCDLWPTVVCDSKFSEDYELIEMDVTSFLCGWVNGAVSPPSFPPRLRVTNKPFLPLGNMN
jgi:hypothetical protein